MSTYTVGPYTVRIGLRPDNPAWPQYLVYLAGKLIGKSFSIPDLGCCEWLRRTKGTCYAESSSPLKTHSFGRNYPKR